MSTETSGKHWKKSAVLLVKSPGYKPASLRDLHAHTRTIHHWHVTEKQGRLSQRDHLPFLSPCNNQPTKSAYSIPWAICSSAVYNITHTMYIRSSWTCTSHSQGSEILRAPIGQLLSVNSPKRHWVSASPRPQDFLLSKQHSNPTWSFYRAHGSCHIWRLSRCHLPLQRY